MLAYLPFHLPSIIIALTTIFCLTGCNSGDEGNNAPEKANANIIPGSSNSNINTGTNQKPLDLSLPEEEMDISALEASSHAGAAQQDSTLPDLFQQKEADKQLEVSAKPHLQMGESMTDIPDISGGTVTIKVQTD